MIRAAGEEQQIQSLLESTPAKSLFQSRIIVLSEGINSQVAKRVIQELLALENLDAQKDITIYLNSPGGEVSSGFAIYDTLRFIKPRTRIVVTGLAASIATVILLGAQKDDRLCMPNARLLIHQPLIGGTMQGQASDIEITANEMIKTRERIEQLYHDETGQSIERVRRDIERDYWMSAKESVEYGLIKRIVAKRGDI